MTRHQSYWMNQTGVALKRIAVYLEEEEVTDQVSTLKKDYSQPRLPGAEDDDLGLENATLKWNEVAEDVDKDTDKRKSNSGPPTESSDADETGTAVGDSSSERGTESVEGNGNGERVFELRDISVRFPPGELTVVTGPTASGKTALLVCCSSILLFFY